MDEKFSRGAFIRGCFKGAGALAVTLFSNQVFGSLPDQSKDSLEGRLNKLRDKPAVVRQSKPKKSKIRTEIFGDTEFRKELFQNYGEGVDSINQYNTINHILSSFKTNNDWHGKITPVGAFLTLPCKNNDFQEGYLIVDREIYVIRKDNENFFFGARTVKGDMMFFDQDYKENSLLVAYQVGNRKLFASYEAGEHGTSFYRKVIAATHPSAEGVYSKKRAEKEIFTSSNEVFDKRDKYNMAFRTITQNNPITDKAAFVKYLTQIKTRIDNLRHKKF